MSRNVHEQLLVRLGLLESVTCGRWENLMWTTEMRKVSNELVATIKNVDAQQMEAACLCLVDVCLALVEMNKSEREARDRLRNHTVRKRTKAFASKAEKDQACRAAAKLRAREVWDGDSNNQLRIGDVTTEVVSFLEDLVYPALDIKPYKADTVRRWVKEVAPSYASKPGRRKK